MFLLCNAITPVGAHIASEVSPTVLGNEIDVKSLVSLSIPECEVRSSGILGYIQYVDYFGNLITNIPGVLVQGKSWFVRIGDKMISGSYTYSDRPPGAILALVSSHGWVEVAVNCGNAKLTLQLDWLDQLVVVLG